MGNCCSYVLKFDHSNPVTDPVTVNEIQQVCDNDKGAAKVSPKKAIKSKKKDPPPKNGGLILSLPPADKRKPSSTGPTPNPPTEKEKEQEKEKFPAVLGKTQTLMVEPSPQNAYLGGNGSGSKTVDLNVPGSENKGLKSASLNPEDITRKDARALTAREEEMQKKQQPKKELVNLEQLKIADEILKKIEKLNVSSNKGKEQDEGGNSPLRSQTLGNEDNLFDDVLEGTGNTRKEEIKKNLIETKDNLEKLHVLEKKPSKNLITKEEEKPKELKERSKSIDKRHMIGNGNNNENQAEEKTENQNAASAMLPRKSLLKRFKTIGDDGKREKSKKKVKFKDLFDSRGKKKVKRTKKP